MNNNKFTWQDGEVDFEAKHPRDASGEWTDNAAPKAPAKPDPGAAPASAHPTAATPPAASPPKKGNRQPRPAHEPEATTAAKLDSPDAINKYTTDAIASMRALEDRERNRKGFTKKIAAEVHAHVAKLEELTAGITDKKLKNAVEEARLRLGAFGRVHLDRQDEPTLYDADLNEAIASAAKETDTDFKAWIKDGDTSKPVSYQAVPEPLAVAPPRALPSLPRPAPPTPDTAMYDRIDVSPVAMLGSAPAVAPTPAAPTPFDRLTEMMTMLVRMQVEQYQRPTPTAPAAPPAPSKVELVLGPGAISLSPNIVMPTPPRVKETRAIIDPQTQRVIGTRPVYEDEP